MRLHLAPSIALVVCALGVACGEKPAATPIDAAATAADTTAGAPAGTVADAVADAAADVAAETQVDTGPVGIDPKSVYGKRCSAISAKLCAEFAACCGKEEATCVAGVTKQCLDPGKFDNVAIAAAAGDLILDPALDVTCTAAIARVGQVCDNKAFEEAFLQCLFAWVDPAGLDKPCSAPVDVACAGGKGRCVVVLPPDDVKCLAANTHGESCSKLQPCQLMHTCLDTDLPRAKQCSLWGSKCFTKGDVVMPCAAGFVCNQESCVPDPGVAKGGACLKDPECRKEHVCAAGKCMPKMCPKA